MVVINKKYVHLRIVNTHNFTGEFIKHVTNKDTKIQWNAKWS